MFLSPVNKFVVFRNSAITYKKFSGAGDRISRCHTAFADGHGCCVGGIVRILFFQEPHFFIGQYIAGRDRSSVYIQVGCIGRRPGGIIDAELDFFGLEDQTVSYITDLERFSRRNASKIF